MSTTTAGASADLRGRARQVIASWFEAPAHRPVADAWLRGFEPEFSRSLAREGLLGLSWPTEYGGAGRSNVDRLAVTEELLRAGAPSAAHWSSERQIGPALLRLGTPEAKEELLPRILSVDAIFCLGMSERGAGSDLAAVETTATRVGGGWLINGTKMWTGHAHRATHAYVLARTSREERKHQGLSEFLVDMDPSTITVTPIINLLGEHRFNRVDFTDAFVPDHRLLGEEGNGWRQVVEQLSFERGGSERYLSSYILFSELLRRAGGEGSGALDHLIGGLTQRLAVLRRLGHDVARMLDAGGAPIKEAAALKLLGNQFEVDVIEALRRCPVPEDSRRSSDFAASVQSSPGFELRGGSVEVLLSIIAREEARS
ncbi:alkylation response protein AidB-like acyl-CoA dehydrogenase [Microbacterium resistens]|uniref:Alkylation response protein AidB-like acyl-CoA dehydrogenase n=1 Tax=Microbacterium resistens TaxID=156977 RepID=A0ABU1SAH3_9MICO|nr:acyl-CoA dehydrogenase family protein [Microbacterium resistens]MDR6866609.1 alkylation response protein AidB-like acyl-CoA dehydrogenase [Microbacterium resistens]